SSFFHLHGRHPALPSFPTRRSSDLISHMRNISSPMSEIHPAEVEITVPIRSDTEDHLLDKTLNRFAESLAAEGDLDAGILIVRRDRKSTRLNSSHVKISYAVFCLKK